MIRRYTPGLADSAARSNTERPGRLTPQVHHPHHFFLAWSLALMASGRNTQVQTLDSTVWIEANQDMTVFHASNKSAYLRTTIPTLDGTGSDWRHIVYDPYRQARDIANKSKAVRPDQEEMLSRVLTLLPVDEGDKVEVKLIDPAERTSMTTEVPVHDLDWPYTIIADYDRHEADAQFSMGITPEFATLFAQVTKLLGTTVTISPDSGKAAFSVTHPVIPEVKVEGVAATKTP